MPSLLPNVDPDGPLGFSLGHRRTRIFETGRIPSSRTALKAERTRLRPRDHAAHYH